MLSCTRNGFPDNVADAVAPRRLPAGAGVQPRAVANTLKQAGFPVRFITGPVPIGVARTGLVAPRYGGRCATPGDLAALSEKRYFPCRFPAVDLNQSRVRISALVCVCVAI